MITHIGFDADDTLWINEDYFKITSDHFLDSLADYGPKQEIMKMFYQIERKNLDYFGYGIKGFVLSLIETALTLTDNKISGKKVKQYIDWGKSMQNATINLLPNVKDTLQKLAPKYKLLMITKGDLFEQETKIARSDLSDYFQKIHIVSEKDQEQYKSILAEEAINPINFMMIGNSLHSDIKPVVTIGAKAIHIAYKHEWVNDLISENERRRLEYYQLNDISQVPDFVENLNIVLHQKKEIVKNRPSVNSGKINEN